MLHSFSDVWQNACREDHPHPAGAAGQLLAALAALLDVEQVQEQPINRAALFLCDLSSLAFSRMDLNVVMVAQPPRDADEAREQANLLAGYKQAVESVGFCFPILLSDNPPAVTPSLPSALDAVVMAGPDLARLFSSPPPPAPPPP